MDQPPVLDKPAKGLAAPLNDPDLPAVPAATLQILKLAPDAAASISDIGYSLTTDPILNPRSASGPAPTPSPP